MVFIPFLEILHASLQPTIWPFFYGALSPRYEGVGADEVDRLIRFGEIGEIGANTPVEGPWR
jgi:hypothetical protein